MASPRVRRLLNLYHVNANGLMDKVDKNIQKQIVKKAEQEKKKQGDTSEESAATYDTSKYEVGSIAAQEQVIVSPEKTYVVADNMPSIPPPSGDFFLEVYEIISDIPKELEEEEVVEVVEENQEGEKVKKTTRARKTNDRIKKVEGPKNKTKKANISYEKKRTGKSDDETVPS